MSKKLIFVLTVLLVAGLFMGCQQSSSGGGGQAATVSGPAGGEEMRIVVVPKVVHPWFDDLVSYSRLQAEELGRQIGRRIVIDYRAPTTADVAEQNSIIQQAAATRPTGIAIDLLDYNGTAAVVEEVRRQGIPVVFFDAEAPDDSGIPQVGSPAADQARIAAECLAQAINYRGKVAIMRGVPTAPNHEERYNYYWEYFRRYPNITLIQGGVDNDDIQTAQQQAAATIAANPDLVGYIGSNAAYPIGVGNAVREAGKTGQIFVVGLESMIETLELIKEGVLYGTSTAPTAIQGSQVVMLIWQQSMGNRVPLRVNTGIDLVTRANVDDALAEARNITLKDANLRQYGIGQR